MRRARRPRALVVDDSPAFLRIVRAVLEDTTPPFEVEIAGSGTEAIARLNDSVFRAAPLDMLVLDLAYPT